MKARKILVASAVEATSRPDVVDVLRCRLSVMESLNRLGFPCLPFDIARSEATDGASLNLRLEEADPLCLFNLFEGFSDAPAQESAFAALLEERALPFTGNGSETLALCLDKERTRRRLADRGLPVPQGRSVEIGDLSTLPSLLTFDAPFFLKPRCEDGSVGIDGTSLVTEEKALAGALAAKLKRFPEGVVVEEFLPGREFAVAFLGNDPYDGLPPSVIDYGRYGHLPPYLAYEAKWDEEAPDYAIMPESCRDDDSQLPSALALAREAGRALGCRGFFRVDLREGRDGRLRIIDVNPNPDLNVDSGFARQAGRAGLTYDDIIARLVFLALEGKEVRTLEEPCPLRLSGAR
ncbi:D-alanine--D-alanine ligase [Aminithiophilus ramosus]|uniref:D-alanine--D-alanine ligase n=1 Tax=Aminithiophilus ramosus TaxID=3029084 RepID=A0A9Q7ANJ5_9BACT|nr:D-alanine--D-alanine ligase [Aminithiophilus ramosus]QTX32722.1 D-alanine--D-alanine ligase [Aminithiophilus ramosus]